MIDKKQYKYMNKKELNAELLDACAKGHLDIAQYLLTSPELKEHANIYHQDTGGWNALMVACYYGNLTIVKYLLTSSELKENVNIHDKNNYGSNVLMFACARGYLDIVKYLLTSPELKEHVDIYHKDNYGDNALISSCVNEHLDIVEYLVIDMNMKVDENTKHWLQGNNDNEIVYEDTLKLIKTRDLHQKVDSSVNVNNKKSNTIKV